MDTGNKGKIDVNELRAGLHKLGHQIPDADIQVLMDAVSSLFLTAYNIPFVWLDSFSFILCQFRQFEFMVRAVSIWRLMRFLGNLISQIQFFFSYIFYASRNYKLLLELHPSIPFATGYEIKRNIYDLTKG